MNLLRTLALGLWMAGLYSIIVYPEDWLRDPSRVLVEMTLWNVGWLLAAWTFTLGAATTNIP
ncbi:MAG: hypothetical protein KF760_26545 [Candidatus Eremiobacteraeota bacterium]|nr:hypothetical protein [Candidatus Eremiobacteraeota bacterium]MCW5870549.1 hypothetical protein [Candidatus Eremiobacteraeota bacterium]